MEQEFNNLGNLDINLGVTWSVFGNADRSDIDNLLLTNSINGAARLIVVDLWKRHPNHPNRKQERFSHVDFQPAVDASLIMSVNHIIAGKKQKPFTSSVSAVAISKRRALTALHGKIPLNSPVKVTTRNGVHFSGFVEFERFEENMVDIAVILLDAGSEFSHFIAWNDQPVVLTQRITIVGLKYGSVGDAVNTYARSTTVDMIEEFGPSSALFQAQYYNFDGCSGTGVVTATVNNVVKVVGVHVASHEDTSIARKRKRITSKFGIFDASVQSDIHGHKAYCLVCEIVRVPDLIALLTNNR